MQWGTEPVRTPDRGENEPAFLVDVDGFEGPLDLLLELARRQKVDLAKISILALAEQYLAFVEEARRLRLELAADYLVMAAWLAFLKSRLLLPEPPKGEEPSAADLASALAERLRRLEAIRRAADALGQRARLGRDMFLRGAAEGVEVSTRPKFEAKLFDLLTAYARQRQKTAVTQVTLRQRDRLVARRSARGSGAACRRGGGMDGARRLPLAVLSRFADGAHRARLGLFGLARNGARRPHPHPPGPRLRAALGEARGSACARGGSRRLGARPGRRRAGQ